MWEEPAPVGGTNPGQVVLGGIRKEIKCDLEDEISIPALKFFVGFLPWLPSMMEYDLRFTKGTLF